MLAYGPRQADSQVTLNVMRTKTKVGFAIGGTIAGVTAVLVLGPAVSFFLFHSDWTPVPHLLTVGEGAAALRVEVVDSKGTVLCCGPSRTAARNQLEELTMAQFRRASFSLNLQPATLGAYRGESG